MRNGKIGFGILGCGTISKIHAQAIGMLPDAYLIGVADASAEATERFADRYGVKAFCDYKSMLLAPEIDVVCVCTPSGLHAEHAMEALSHGKHVVLEKPMALTTEDADRLIEATTKSGRLLTVISQLRFSEDIKRVKKIVDDGALGRITLASLRMKYYRSREYYSSWKGTKKLDGGGALMNQGIHGVDLFQYLLGPVKDVKGRIATLFHSIEVEDTAVAMLEFESGALGVLEASTCAYPGFAREIEIHGDRGYVILKEDHIEKMMINGEEISSPRDVSCETANDPTKLNCEGHARQIGNLLSAIRGEGELSVDGKEGRKALEIIEKIYLSSETGQ